MQGSLNDDAKMTLYSLSEKSPNMSHDITEAPPASASPTKQNTTDLTQELFLQWELLRATACI